MMTEINRERDSEMATKRKLNDVKVETHKWL